MRRSTLLLLLFIAGAALGQGTRHVPLTTQASLGTCDATREGIVKVISDGLTEADCTVGGGTVAVACQCLDGVFVAVSGVCHSAAVGPTANEDSGDGYVVGSTWCDTTADTIYQAIDVTPTAAIWRPLVAGPSSATDNAVARFDATTGQLLQNSGATLDDNAVLTLPGTGRVEVTGNATAGQDMCLKEDTDLGASDWCIDIAATDLTTAFSITPQVSGLLQLSSLIHFTATDRVACRDTAAAGAAEECTVGGGLEFTGSTGLQRSALTGDVTASAGSASTTVATVPTGASVTITEADSITISEVEWVDAASCTAATATLNWDDDPNLNEPGATCRTPATGITFASADFDPDTDEAMMRHFRLPTDWTGTIDIIVLWRAPAITGNVVWAVQTYCTGDGEADTGSFQAAGSVTDVAKGTNNLRNEAAMTSITTTGCSAGDDFYLQLFRDADNVSDTVTVDAQMIGTEVTYRRDI